MSIKDKIPFSVAYSNEVGMYESRSPLYDIAELNPEALQIQSDLDNILHIVLFHCLQFLVIQTQMR